VSEHFVHEARTNDDIAEVAALAHEIWNDHFPDIIGQGQVDYMLDRFQSKAAIRTQIQDDHYEYYLVGEPGDREGYFAIVQDADSLQLSKLYLRRAARGRGMGARIVRWLEAESRARGVSRLWLTVNKDNAGSIAFYRSVGFEVESAMVTDIGRGFVMDDYRMVAIVHPDST
jgi:ribosomal protein S18 acetylase RimI-like enzyme